MRNAIANSLLWGVMFFVTGCLFFIHSPDVSWQKIFAQSVVTILGFFLGHLQGQSDPSGRLRTALISGLFSTIAAGLLSALYSGSASFFIQPKVLMEICSIAAMSALLGRRVGQMSGSKANG